MNMGQRARKDLSSLLLQYLTVQLSQVQIFDFEHRLDYIAIENILEDA